MAISKEPTKLKPTFKLADEFLDLKKLDTNVFVQQLEESIKFREQPVEVQARRKLRID